MKFEKYTLFLEKYGRFFLAFVFLLISASIAGLFRVKINADFNLFAPKNSRFIEGEKLMEQAFGNDSQIMLLASGELSIAGVRKILGFSDACSGIEGVSQVLSAFPASLAEKDDSQIASQISLVTKTESGSMKSVITDEDGTWFLLRIMLSDTSNIRNSIKEIKELADSRLTSYSISGEPYLETEIFNYILRILLIIPPIAIFLILAVFRIRIGSFRATVLSMVPAVITAILTLGIISWILKSISIMTVLIPVFIIVLGSADGLHVTSHMIDLIRSGESNRDAISKTLKAVGIPIILTSLTTMAGFLSLSAVKSQSITEMSIIAAGGILLAGIVTWIILPVLLLHQKPLTSARKEKTSGIVSVLEKMTGKTAVIVSLLIVIASVPGLMMIKSDFSMVDMYKSGTSVRKSIEEMSKRTGGAFPLMILAETDNYSDPSAAVPLLDFQNSLEEKGIVAGSMSIYSMIALFSEQLSSKPGYPTQELFAKRVSSMIQNQNSDLYNTLVAENGWTRIVLFADSLKTKTLNDIIEEVDQLQEKTGIKLYPAGTAFEMMKMNLIIVPQQLQSLVIALAAVIILNSLFLKKIRAGLLAAVPIIVTLFGLFAVMGYAGIDISIITSIMTGLTIGVGIDYAIHYISLYYYYKKQGHHSPSRQAIKYVATPVLANAMGLSIGFTAMIFSPFQIHTTLSVLMWVTMLLSAFLSLSLLPTLTGAAREKK